MEGATGLLGLFQRSGKLGIRATVLVVRCRAVDGGEWGEQ